MPTHESTLEAIGAVREYGFLPGCPVRPFAGPDQGRKRSEEVKKSAIASAMADFLRFSHTIS